MRIWSLHPCHLDTKGLVALWRETLLAKHVLEGRTKGYRNHPQLNRFRKCKRTLDAVNYYLSVVHEESLRRGYHFDAAKFRKVKTPPKLTVTRGQLDYELRHLLTKLKQRDKERYKELAAAKCRTHPLFRIVAGAIESWEITS